MNENLANNQTCCGGLATQVKEACCVRDEKEKLAGNNGCGCNDKREESSESASSCCSSTGRK